MRTVALLLLAASVSPAADTPKKEATKMEKKLWVAISVNKPIVERGAAGDPFMMHFALLNDGDKTINPRPEVESSQLLVNGKELKDWSFIVANGIRDKRWEALPPGDYLTFGYSLGNYFDKPGTYKVTWKGRGFESAAVVFRVVPKREK